MYVVEAPYFKSAPWKSAIKLNGTPTILFRLKGRNPTEQEIRALMGFVDKGPIL
jgi:hypothetical protein